MSQVERNIEGVCGEPFILLHLLVIYKTFRTTVYNFY